MNIVNLKQSQMSGKSIGWKSTPRGGGWKENKGWCCGDEVFLFVFPMCSIFYVRYNTHIEDVSNTHHQHYASTTSITFSYITWHCLIHFLSKKM